MRSLMTDVNQGQRLGTTITGSALKTHGTNAAWLTVTSTHGHEPTHIGHALCDET